MSEYRSVAEQFDAIIDEEILVPSGEKVKLVAYYPDSRVKVTKGQVYNLIDEWRAEKQLKNVAIPLRFARIFDDEGQPVMITMSHFEKV